MKDVSKKVKILSWVCFALFPLVLPISLLYFIFFNILVVIKDVCDRISELIVSGEAFDIKKIRENLADDDYHGL